MIGKNRVEQQLALFIESLIAEIDVAVPEMRLRDQSHHGSWSNPNGVVLAYLSYTSGTESENPLEVVISVAPTHQGFQFSADICQSDGEILAAITDSYVVARTQDDLLRQIDQLGKIAQQGIVQRLKGLLLPI